MTDDLVTRLRDLTGLAENLCCEAADEIERMEAQSWKVDADVLSMREEIEQQRYEIERLRALVNEAVEEVVGWGAYASDYFQRKRQLQDIITSLRARIMEPGHD
jgi:hypothetical protein